MNTYTTRNEAITREIVEPIEAAETIEDAYTEFDVDAIAEKIIATSSPDSGDQVYYCTVDPEGFWKIVEEHAK